MTHRALLALVCAFPLLSACSDQEQAYPQSYSGRVVRGEVEVVGRLEEDSLTATFTPQRPGFHVYSVDLPDEGIEGLGVPTRIAVRAGARSAGAVVADRPVRLLDYPSLDVRLPVYPDGPVTLTVPILRDEGDPELRVTYAACSESLCLAPVRDLLVRLHP